MIAAATYTHIPQGIVPQAPDIACVENAHFQYFKTGCQAQNRKPSPLASTLTVRHRIPRS